MTSRVGDVSDVSDAILCKLPYAKKALSIGDFIGYYVTYVTYSAQSFWYQAIRQVTQRWHIWGLWRFRAQSAVSAVDYSLQNCAKCSVG